MLNEQYCRNQIRHCIDFIRCLQSVPWISFHSESEEFFYDKSKARVNLVRTTGKLRLVSHKEMHSTKLILETLVLH